MIAAAACTLAACAPAPVLELTPPPRIGAAYPATLGVAEPGPRELVIMVNDNRKMVHAGMFVGDRLFDPAGSYASSRRSEQGWPGPSLHDYLRFQLDDGPVVRLYRFALPVERLAQVNARLDLAGSTLPLFCAAKVQNIIAGIEPFATLPDAWLTSPAMLARQLDAVLAADAAAGSCVWPDGTACYRPAHAAARATASR